MPRDKCYRHLKDRLFKKLVQWTTFFALLCLSCMIASMAWKGRGAFYKTTLTLPSALALEHAPQEGPTRDTLPPNYLPVLCGALKHMLHLDALSLQEEGDLLALVSPTAVFVLHHFFQNKKNQLESQFVVLKASDNVDYVLKNNLLDAEHQEILNDKQIKWLMALKAEGSVRFAFNDAFFTGNDSRDPTRSGLFGAMVASVCLMCVTLLFAFPTGVAAAIYLSEFAQNKKFAHFIEINLSNLVAVPSIVYGLVGLCVFIGLFGLPRSSIWTGGLTLGVMMMPMVVIVTLGTLRSVPLIMREAAFALGASKVQVVFHHILPAATAGIITGALLGLVRTFGESAPLLMVGMAAFIIDTPTSFNDPAISLPLQIFTWARYPEKGFLENTAGAIVILLLFSGLISYIAFIMRKKLRK